MTALLHSQIVPRFPCKIFRTETKRQKAVAPVSVNSAVPTKQMQKMISCIYLNNCIRLSQLQMA